MIARLLPYRVRRAVADISSLAPPGVVIGTAALIGRGLQHLHAAWPAPAELAALFDGFPVRDRNYVAMAHTIVGLHGRRVALRSIVERRGIDVALAMLDNEGLEGLEVLRNPTRPIVAMTSHFGPPAVLSAALARAQIRVLAVRRNERKKGADFSTIAATGGDERGQAAALWRAVQWLRDGGVVVVAGDGPEGERAAPVSCLGRAIRFGRGAFAMARMSGAAVIPIAGLWTRAGRIRVHVESPLAFVPGESAESFETNAARAFAAWYEGMILAHPEQMRIDELRGFLGAKRVDLEPTQGQPSA